MRRLVWIAGGFAAAAFLAEYLLPVRGLPYLAAALALCGAVCIPLKRLRARPQALLLLFSAAAGLLYWWGWFELRVAPCEALAGQDLTLTARVTDYPLETERYTRLSVTVLDGAPRERGVSLCLRRRGPGAVPGGRDLRRGPALVGHDPGRGAEPYPYRRRAVSPRLHEK